MQNEGTLKIGARLIASALQVKGGMYYAKRES